MTTLDLATQAASLSREFALAVDADGVVRWADDRAAQALGVATGQRLGSLSVAGGEDKVERLVRDAAAGAAVRDWETLLQVDGAATPVVFRGTPGPDGGALLVGSLVGADYGRLVGEMSETMSQLSTLHREMARQRQEIAGLNQDLDESGRGLRALYAELGETSDTLRDVSEGRLRFLANVGHELRTPINSILGLSQLLVARADGPLTPEQEKQIGFVRQSATVLSDLVTDLLDLGKADAGKLRVRAARVNPADLFGALRGMLRPLVPNDRVTLVFEPPEGIGPLETDDGKLSQILRNLVSNALKFTEHGEVRVSARDNGDGTVSFAVRDTGIGIPRAHHERIFEEFTQVDSALQRQVKGTGLGLTLSRRLARLLGGDIAVRSEEGRGSTFTLTVPSHHPEVAEAGAMIERARQLDPHRAPVLVVEDDTQTLFLYEKYLEGSGFQVIPARSTDEAREVLRRVKPAAVVMDVMLEGETTWSFLEEMKRSPETRDVPTLVVTVMDREHKARALGADEFFVKPIDRDWLLRRLHGLSHTSPVERVLVIDDDEVSRYLVRRLLAGTRYSLIEAADGPEGVRVARETRPDVILLDFVMPTMTAFEVLDELKCDPRTRNIPVIVSTSKQLDEHEQRRLAADTSAVLSKAQLSRELAIARIREALGKAVGMSERAAAAEAASEAGS